MTVISRGGYNADNQLTLWGSQGFLYDLNGNMTADGNNAYAWNVRNQLVALTPDGGTADTFVYDAFGRRQKKVINGTETDFLFDQNGNLAAELTDGGEYLGLIRFGGHLPKQVEVVHGQRNRAGDEASEA
jgi:YD repeat-containing protein